MTFESTREKSVSNFPKISRVLNWVTSIKEGFASILEEERKQREIPLMTLDDWELEQLQSRFWEFLDFLSQQWVSQEKIEQMSQKIHIHSRGITFIVDDKKRFTIAHSDDTIQKFHGYYSKNKNIMTWEDFKDILRILWGIPEHKLLFFRSILWMQHTKYWTEWVTREYSKWGNAFELRKAQIKKVKKGKKSKKSKEKENDIGDRQEEQLVAESWLEKEIKTVFFLRNSHCTIKSLCGVRLKIDV